ncbi:MAG TPA: hypothetical protein VIV34_09385 [Pseudolabrys sp.]
MNQAVIARFLANADAVRRQVQFPMHPTTGGTIHPGRRPSEKTGAVSTNTFCADGVNELKS